MLEKFVLALSSQMGMSLSKVSIVEGQPLGCIDVQLVTMYSKGRVVSALVFQADINNLESGAGCDSLEVRMRGALSRLKRLLDP